ncbi:MAG: ABC transporter substrate-binding protein [Burkholderiales bacterium]|nr:ABC transporter substrate-binding protein [Burkholderiales bacterium]
MNSIMEMKKLLLPVSFAVVLALGLATPAAAADKVILKTDFSPVGYHAMFYGGVGSGIYKKHDLDVEILPGAGALDSVVSIAGGKITFALADTGGVAIAVLNGAREPKVVANIFEFTPMCILYLKDKGIGRPQDLAGKTVANFGGSAGQKLWKVFARINKVDIANVKEIVSSPATYLNPLVVGQADFSPTTVNQTPNLAPLARQSGHELAEFRFVDYGMNYLGSSIITHAKTIEQRPDLVRRFVRATLESVQWTARNPEAAVDYLVQSNPQLKKPAMLLDLKTMLDVSIPRARTAGNPLQLGWIDPAKLRLTIDLMREAFDLKTTIDPAILYTNDYVAKP